MLIYADPHRPPTTLQQHPMESFFALLQKNVLNRHAWPTREELRLAMITWIEKSYHRRRRQRRLGKLTPVEFEVVHQARIQAA